MSQMKEWREEIRALRKDLRKIHARLKDIEAEISSGVDD